MESRLRIHAEAALHAVEVIDDSDRTVDSARLLVAARTFMSTVEVFEVMKKSDAAKEQKGT